MGTIIFKRLPRKRKKKFDRVEYKAIVKRWAIADMIDKDLFAYSYRENGDTETIFPKTMRAKQIALKAKKQLAKELLKKGIEPKEAWKKWRK